MFNLVPFNRKNRDLFAVNDFFNEFFNNFSNLNPGNFNEFKTDIKETDDQYIVQAELPGVNKENIDIELNENYMTITAINNEIVEEEKDNYIRKERRTGKFQRCFNIKDVKAEGIEAQYDNGILEIKLPKSNIKSRVKKINIQ